MANYNLPMNIAHLNEMAAKLDAAADADCDAINQFFKRNLDQLNDWVKEHTKDLKDLTEWGDIIDFNPFSFVKKLIKKFVGPALAAAITMAIQLALLLKAIINVIAAVQRLVQKVIGCVVSNIARLAAVVGQVTNALKGALAKILTIKDQLKAQLQAQLAAEVSGVLAFVNQAKANAVAEVNSYQNPNFGDGKGSETVKGNDIPPTPTESAPTTTKPSLQSKITGLVSNLIHPTTSTPAAAPAAAASTPTGG